MKLNATQKQAIASAVKTGFTFAGDSFFKTFRSAKIALTSLVAAGYLTEKKDEYGVSYLPTEAARDFVAYGIQI